jgi:site-specific DNA-methyltransferase (adenine-specific)
MILNQFGRRNLSSYQRSVLALQLEEVFREKAKAKQEIGINQYSLPQKSAEPSNKTENETRYKIGKVAKVSHDTIAKVKKIEATATPEVKAKLSTGEVSINQAYQEIKKEEKERQKTQKAEEIKNSVYTPMTNIYFGSCLEYVKTIPNNSIDCLITDPPYGVDFQFNKYDNQLSRKIENDTKEAFDLLNQLLLNSKDKMKPNAHIYIFCSWKVYPEFKSIIERYFNIRNLIIWNKKLMGMGDLKYNYADMYEMIIFAGGQREFIKRPANIIECRFDEERFHNTQKPVKLLCELITNSTNEGDMIFDPFLGSGSTAVAAQQSKRNFCGCEIDKQNYQITLKRLHNERI